MSEGDRGDGGIVQHLAPGQGRPGLGGDALGSVELAQRVLGQVRVELDLVDRRHDGRPVEQALEVIDLEVGDADGVHVAALEQSLHGSPGVEVVNAVHRQRPMDEEKVDVANVERTERALKGLPHVVGSVGTVVELAGDEDLGAGDGRPAHRLLNLGLVAVHLGRIDVAITDLERAEGGPLRIGRIDLEDAETELRYFDPVVERDGGDGGGQFVHGRYGNN